MTPTLTNAQKYSPEFGFSPGVVVEVIDVKNVKYTGYFTQLMLPDTLSAYHRFQLDNGAFNVFGFMVKDIKSIRILSGQWAIWNFAPAGTAVCCIEDSDILFFTTREWEQLKPLDGVVMPAPWWWLEGEK